MNIFSATEIWTHASILRPEAPLTRKEWTLESDKLDHSDILTPVDNQLFKSLLEGIWIQEVTLREQVRYLWCFLSLSQYVPNLNFTTLPQCLSSQHFKHIFMSHNPLTTSMQLRPYDLYESWDYYLLNNLVWRVILSDYISCQMHSFYSSLLSWVVVILSPFKLC